MGEVGWEGWDGMDAGRRWGCRWMGWEERDGMGTEEESVVLGESVGRCDGDIRLWRRIHLLQHILRQRLRNPTHISIYPN